MSWRTCIARAGRPGKGRFPSARVAAKAPLREGEEHAGSAKPCRPVVWRHRRRSFALWELLSAEGESALQNVCSRRLEERQARFTAVRCACGKRRQGKVKEQPERPGLAPSAWESELGACSRRSRAPPIARSGAPSLLNSERCQRSLSRSAEPCSEAAGPPARSPAAKGPARKALALPHRPLPALLLATHARTAGERRSLFLRAL